MIKTKQKKNTEWGVKKLGELCELSIGKTPPRGDKKFWDTEKKTNNIWLSIADLKKTDGIEIFDSKEYISEDGAKLFSIVKKGILLVSFKLTLGRLAFAGTDLRTNEAIAALNNLSDEIDKNYLYYFLSFFDWSKATEGEEKVKGKTLNKAKLKEIEISFPKSLDEQRRIVEILDRSFEAIGEAKENAEKNLQNAKELFDTYSKDLYLKLLENNNIEELSNVANLVRGPFGGSLTKSMFVDTGYPVYEQRNAIGNFTDNFRYFIDENKFKEMERFSVKKGDMIMSCSGTIGKFAFIENNSPVGVINQALLKITPNEEKINKDYLLFILKNFIQDGSGHSVGAAIKNIVAVKELKKIKIPIFSLQKQKEIVKKLDELRDEVERLEAILWSKIAGLDELKKSILEKAFNGEL